MNPVLLASLLVTRKLAVSTSSPLVAVTSTAPSGMVMSVTLTSTVSVPVTGPAPPLTLAVTPASGVMAIDQSSVVRVSPSYTATSVVASV